MVKCAEYLKARGRWGCGPGLKLREGSERLFGEEGLWRGVWAGGGAEPSCPDAGLLPGPCCSGSAVSGPGPSRCCPASSLSSRGALPGLLCALRPAVGWPLQSHTGSLFPGAQSSLPCAPLRLLWVLGHIRLGQATLPGPRGLLWADQESPGEAVAQACRPRWDSASGWGPP